MLLVPIIVYCIYIILLYVSLISGFFSEGSLNYFQKKKQKILHPFTSCSSQESLHLIYVPLIIKHPKCNASFVQRRKDVRGKIKLLHN